MDTSQLSKKHPSIKEIAKKPYGKARIRNYGSTGSNTITLSWNPSMAKHGVFELEHDGKKLLIDAEELRWFTRVFTPVVMLLGAVIHFV